MQSYGVIAKQKANGKKNHYFHEIRNLQTLIEIEGQTCFSKFAGLRVLYLNLSLVSWFSLRVPPIAGAGGCNAWKTAFTSVNRVLAHGCFASTAINRAVKHSKTLQLKGVCSIAKIS